MNCLMSISPRQFKLGEPYSEVNFSYGCTCVHACINAWQHSCHRMSACLISQWAISGPAALFLFDAVLHGIALQQSPCPGQCFWPYWNSTPCPWSGLSKRNGSTTRAVGRRVRVRRSTKGAWFAALDLERTTRPANNPRS